MQNMSICKTRSIRILSLLCWALLSTACGSNGGTSSPAPSPPAGGTGSATLTWNAPTVNDDGSPLLDLSGYNIYRGVAPDIGSLALVVALDNPGLVMYVVDNLGAGTHYFSITAVNALSIESEFSNVAQVSIN